MNTARRISAVIRRSLGRTVSALEDRRVVVALSGGVDSCAVLAACLEAGLKPSVVSYTPITHESTDFQMAQETAKALGLKFIPARVDVSPEALERDARRVIDLGFHSKVQVESLAPMLRIALMAQHFGKADVLLTGDQSDGYFCLSKWAAHNYDRSQGVPFRERSRNVKDDTDPTRIDAIRKRYYEEDFACTTGVAAVCEFRGIGAEFPFRDLYIAKAFNGSLWSEVNVPRIKEPIRLAYAKWFEGGGINVRPLQVNLHKGDSHYGETMSKTLTAQPHLQGEWKTPQGLYSAMWRGDV